MDSIIRVDKNTTHRRSMRKPVEAMDVSDESSSLKVHTSTNVSGQKGFSAAEDCKNFLDVDG